MQQHQKRKHFIFVIQAIVGGGAERVVLNLAKLLQPKHRVSIITFDAAKEYDIDFEVDFLVFNHHKYHQGKYQALPRDIRHRIISNRLDRFIKKNLSSPNEDIFVLANLPSAEFFLKHSRFRGAYIIHSTLYRNRKDTVSPASWKRKAKREFSVYGKKPCIAVSDGVKQDMLNTLPGISVRTIYNPVIPSVLIEKSSQSSKKKLPESYVIHVGRFCKEKRHDLLIDAYYKSNIQTPLVLVGKGELESSIRTQIKDLGLEKKVILAGFIKNPYPYVSKAKFMVLSSEVEGLPTVLLESLALGTPAISFDCPSGPSEILPPSNLAPHLDVDRLAQLISSANQNPNAFQSPLGTQFSDDSIIKEYEKISS